MIKSMTNHYHKLFAFVIFSLVFSFPLVRQVSFLIANANVSTSEFKNNYNKELLDICCGGSSALINAVCYYGDTEDIFTYATVQLGCSGMTSQGCSFLVVITSTFTAPGNETGVPDFSDVKNYDLSRDCSSQDTNAISVPSPGFAYQFSFTPNLPNGKYQCTANLYEYSCDMEETDFMFGSTSSINISL